MLRSIRRFVREEEGATMVEYGLLVVLIGLVAAAGALVIGNGLNNMFDGIGTEVDSATVPNIP